MFSNFGLLLALCSRLTSLPQCRVCRVGMVLRGPGGETSWWLKMALRQVHGDVSFGETPSPCILVMLLGTWTLLVWLWVGADGGSIFPPPLSNLVHLIMRTGVLRFRFPPLMLFLRCWHFQAFFFKS